MSDGQNHASSRCGGCGRLIRECDCRSSLSVASAELLTNSDRELRAGHERLSELGVANDVSLSISKRIDLLVGSALRGARENCHATHNGNYTCTLAKFHDGDHVAHGFNYIELHRWKAEGRT